MCEYKYINYISRLSREFLDNVSSETAGHNFPQRHLCSCLTNLILTMCYYNNVVQFYQSLKPKVHKNVYVSTFLNFEVQISLLGCIRSPWFFDHFSSTLSQLLECNNRSPHYWNIITTLYNACAVPRGVCSTVGVFSTVGDIMMYVGDILSTVGDTQYRGGIS